MAELLGPANGLTVLRIGLDRSGSGPARREPLVTFELVAGTQEAVPLGRLPASELGVRRELAGWERPNDFKPPGAIADRLRNLLEPGRALWLEFPPPSGQLRLLPWEALLGELVAVPVLRLPYFGLLPRGAGRSTDVAVVASSPRAKEGFDCVAAIEALVPRLVATQRATHVHVFADLDAYAALRERFAGAEHDSVTVHDPQGAMQFAVPRRARTVTTTAGIRNPWLLWIREELRGRALDGLQFICHGYYADGRGALALASSPLVNSDEHYSRFVGAAELCAFLSATGAWSLALVGPPANFAPVGLLELADSVAQTRPLHVLRHEAAFEADVNGLAEGLDLVFANTPRPAPVLPTTALWVHPQLVAGTHEVAVPGADELLDATGRTALLGSATEEALDADATPAWIAAGTRALEQVHGEFLGSLGRGPGGSPAEPPSTDVEDALRTAADLLDRHVRAAKGEDAT
jgi:hypothetical protein